MRKITSDYIFPLNQAPVKSGILITGNNGEIIDLVNPENTDYTINDVEKYEGFICPGFINTHCHLELSYLKSFKRNFKGLNDFILSLDKERKNATLAKEIAEAMKAADIEMQNNGTVAIGDISNNDTSLEIKKQSKLYYHNFVEALGSNPEHAQKAFDNSLNIFKRFNEVSASSIVPHSPYSLSGRLFELIMEFTDTHKHILSIHHQESIDENLFFLNRTGNIPERAKLMGIDNSSFKPTGLKPLKSLSKYFPEENHLQLVHNIYTEQDDIEHAKSKFKNLWWCFCPKANLYIENRLPDINLFIKNNCKITIGTDSLAANDRLSILDELKVIFQYYREIPLNELLKWGILNGAEYLKIDNKYGSFDKGKHPGIVLIERIDSENLMLLPDSKSRNLF